MYSKLKPFIENGDKSQLKNFYILTNCLVVKKHRDIVNKDLLPLWISQKYIYDTKTQLDLPIEVFVRANHNISGGYADGFDKIFGIEWK